MLPPTGRPACLLTSKRFMRGPRHIHTRADPFLFRSGDDLYLFIETQVLDDPGRIEAYVSNDGQDFRSVGVILAEPFHLSYPQVFGIGNAIFMLPESQGAGAVRLYKFVDFPTKLELHRELLIGKYADPSLFFEDGVWYVFATSSRGLELFVTDDLIDGALELHPASPITHDPRYSRCGGVPFRMNDRLIRPTQDYAERYGQNLNLMQIDILSPTDYRETPYEHAIFTGDAAWNAGGGHHVSVCAMPHGVAVAIDGQVDDYLVHKIITRLWMKMTGYKRPIMASRIVYPGDGAR